MIENFELVERTFAFAPELVAQLPLLVEQYGAEAFDAGLKETFPVIFARWDDALHTRIRAASRESEPLVFLSDGRLAVERALFTKALSVAVARGEVAAQELSAAELAALRTM